MKYKNHNSRAVGKQAVGWIWPARYSLLTPNLNQLDEFAMAAVTKYHELGGLKQQKFIVL